MKLFISIITLILVNAKIFGQDNKKTMRYIDKEEYLEILSKNSCIQLNSGNLNWQEYPNAYNYFECNKSFYIKEDNLNNNIILFETKDELYKNLSLDEKYNLMTPLKDKDSIIQNIENNKNQLIKELLSKLNIQIEEDISLTNLDLTKMNVEINKQIPLDLYNNYLLNFMVFCGELVNETKGGHWEYSTNIAKPTELKLFFVDAKNKNYDFLINVMLVREFSKFIGNKGAFDIEKIIKLLTLDLDKINGEKKG